MAGRREACSLDRTQPIRLLPALLRSTRMLPGGPNDAYRSQKAVETKGHLGNVGLRKAGNRDLTKLREWLKPG